MKTWVQILIAMLLLCRSGQAQGFINLDFEAAKNLGSPGSFVQLSATNAFPGWTVSAGYIVYDDISLSGESISIMDTNPPYGVSQPIQGKYFAILAAGNYPGAGYPISIGQTGTIPLTALSLIFWGYVGANDVSFNGQTLLLSMLGSTANYNIYGADISAFAGQTGQLLFTVPPYTGGAVLDNIQFSSSPVPEPGALTLSVLGGLILAGLARRGAKKSSAFGG